MYRVGVGMFRVGVGMYRVGVGAIVRHKKKQRQEVVITLAHKLQQLQQFTVSLVCLE